MATGTATAMVKRFGMSEKVVFCICYLDMHTYTSSHTDDCWFVFFCEFLCLFSELLLTFCFTDHFIGRDRAVGPLYVSVCPDNDF